MNPRLVADWLTTALTAFVFRSGVGRGQCSAEIERVTDGRRRQISNRRHPFRRSNDPGSGVSVDHRVSQRAGRLAYEVWDDMRKALTDRDNRVRAIASGM